MKKSIIYWSSIGLCIFLIFALNLIFNFSWQTFLYCLFALSIVVLPCILFVTIIEFLPAKFFDPNKKIFRTTKFETKFYEKIGIKKWKDDIPVIKPVHSKFDKTQIADPKSSEYLFMFLTENCKAGFGHGFSIFWGYFAIVICIFVLPAPFVLSAWLPIAIVSGFFHFLSFAIQRYLRPRLFKLYSMTKAREDSIREKEQSAPIYDGDTEMSPQN